MGSKGQAECGGEQRRAARATLADGARRAATVARAVRLHTSARERRGGGAWRRGRGLTESPLSCAFFNLYRTPYDKLIYPGSVLTARGFTDRYREFGIRKSRVRLKISDIDILTISHLAVT